MRLTLVETPKPRRKAGGQLKLIGRPQRWKRRRTIARLWAEANRR